MSGNGCEEAVVVSSRASVRFEKLRGLSETDAFLHNVCSLMNCRCCYVDGLSSRAVYSYYLAVCSALRFLSVEKRSVDALFVLRMCQSLLRFGGPCDVT